MIKNIFFQKINTFYFTTSYLFLLAIEPFFIGNERPSSTIIHLRSYLGIVSSNSVICVRRKGIGHIGIWWNKKIFSFFRMKSWHNKFKKSTTTTPQISLSVHQLKYIAWLTCKNFTKAPFSIKKYIWKTPKYHIGKFWRQIKKLFFIFFKFRTLVVLKNMFKLLPK